jgi:hypothetical protein
MHVRRASYVIAPPLNCGVMRKGSDQYSSELETLDQLLGGDMPLRVIRTVFPDHSRFVKGISGLIRNGDIVLLQGGTEIPPWKLRELLDESAPLTDQDMEGLSLHLTEQGTARIA